MLVCPSAFHPSANATLCPCVHLLHLSTPEHFVGFVNNKWRFTSCRDYLRWMGWRTQYDRAARELVVALFKVLIHNSLGGPEKVQVVTRQFIPNSSQKFNTLGHLTMFILLFCIFSQILHDRFWLSVTDKIGSGLYVRGIPFHMNS
jgi:hypothetical protein